MAWRLPNGKTINTPKDVTIGDTQYPAQIFYKWSISELATLGIKPFREVRYDTKWYKSAGSVEDEIDGEIVKTYTTVERYTEREAKDKQTVEVKSVYINEIPRATINMEFYDAVGDNDTKKLWSDYITALKNDAKTLKDAVNAAGTYDEIKDFEFEWTGSPDNTYYVFDVEEEPDGV
jgi:hypothetical protein